MTLQSRLAALVSAIGADIKTVSNKVRTVRVVSTTNTALSGSGGGFGRIDDVLIGSGDRILLVGQTNQTQNGVYMYSVNGLTGGWSFDRAPDFDQSSEISSGQVVNVLEGTQHAGAQYIVNVDNPTIGTTPITFVATNASSAGTAVTVTQEGWHVVGAAGEPAFQNGYSNLSGVDFRPASFKKDPSGKVMIRGAIKKVDAGTQVTIFTLPPGYRPTKQEILACDCGSGHARVDVLINGNVILWAGNAISYLSLDGLEFDTEQTTFPAGKSIIPTVNALPLGPTDGDEVYFQNAAMATDGNMWHLRYRAAAPGLYKWEVLGGTEIASEMSSSIGLTTHNVAYTSVAFGDVGVLLPLAGDYDISWSSLVSNFNVAVGDFRILAAVAGVGVMNTGIANYTNPTWYQQFHGKARAKGKAAGAFVSLVFLSASTGQPFQCHERHLFVKPIRVG